MTEPGRVAEVSGLMKVGSIDLCQYILLTESSVISATSFVKDPVLLTINCCLYTMDTFCHS